MCHFKEINRINALSQLRQLSIEHTRLQHPTLPESALCPKTYTDKTANGLTRCIIDWLRFNGHQAERVSSTGRPIDQRKTFTDVTGRQRQIGRLRWVPGTSRKGTADISATINGRSAKIEVKVGRDRQSEAQRQYQNEVEAAGCIYLIVRTFEEFYQWYKTEAPPRASALVQRP